MKYGYTILVAMLFFISASKSPGSEALHPASSAEPSGANNKGNAPAYIRFVNQSSLKKLPVVLQHLDSVLNGPFSGIRKWVGGEGFSVRIYDITCESFEYAAAIVYKGTDSVFQLKLNRFNEKASERALAATLIHETMHCLLLHLLKRVQKEEEEALQLIVNFGLTQLQDSSNRYNNDFFILMNKGQEGQHELIYRLCYPYMVQLLQRFIEKYEGRSAGPLYAQQLMWSGLQGTTAYKKLDEAEKREIEATLLAAKGVVAWNEN
jgi:hypothetical protein